MITRVSGFLIKRLIPRYLLPIVQIAMSSQAIQPTSEPSGTLTATRLATDRLCHSFRPNEFGIVGRSASVDRLRLQVRRIGPHFRTVLLTGAAGTEKEPVARALHRLGSRADGPFIATHAAALEEEPGVATNTKLQRESISPFTELLAAAKAGTLFLDGLTEMPLPLQDRLLYTLRRQELRKSDSTDPGSLRLIAASGENLRGMVSTGHFRQELYQRLAVVEIFLPPLRTRLSDIPELAERWRERSATLYGRRINCISPEALDRLEHHSWPGNVLELETALNNSALRGVGPTLLEEDLPELVEVVSNHIPDLAPVTRLQDVIDRHVLQVLRSCRGNKLRAAEILGISRSTLYRMLESLPVIAI